MFLPKQMVMKGTVISIKSYLSIRGIVAIISVSLAIIIACGNSPTKDDTLENVSEKQTPSLDDMVLIPAGEFIMGSSEGEGAFDEHPQHTVYIDSFYIDKYEVTNMQFQEFVNATGYVTDAERKGWGDVWNPRYPGFIMEHWPHMDWQHPDAWLNYLDRPKTWENEKAKDRKDLVTTFYTISWTGIVERMNHPVVQVSWNDAQAYAIWAGKRLLTEAEWEKAAKGTNDIKWPWGNVFNLNIEGITSHANIGSEGTTPVGSFPTGVSSYNVYNLAGNVQEWVADWYASDYYARSPYRNPNGPDSGKFRALRGGSWKQLKDYQITNSARSYKTPDYTSNFVGFRCAWSR